MSLKLPFNQLKLILEFSNLRDVKETIMSEISNQLKDLKESLPETCTLVAVSKTKPMSAIQEAYETGHLDFGENKVQELAQKAEELPKDIHWHMIGHLQRNKVKYIAPFVHLIHGIDSFKLLKEVDKQGKKVNRIIDCLLQIHIAEEDTKFGLSKVELDEILADNQLKELLNIRIVGMMGMATNSDDEDQVRKEFKRLKQLFDETKNSDHTNVQMNTLSMGMSGDYKIALEEGSSMIRIGSAIFGARNY
ncbi:YggS family pyridoxal phosphate-dependent enzyme [Ekhidna sp.]|uniref:YggS family pyridoxal phosphate-dependent enzyme n=1 Tax=Ekhidna sp. TaxID=2608089 RepID=UPI0032982E50